MEARLFLAKPLGVLRLAAAFPIPGVPTCVGEGPVRQQAAALRGRLRREMKLDSNAQDLALRAAPPERSERPVSLVRRADAPPTVLKTPFFSPFTLRRQVTRHFSQFEA